jgi:hypothetical protein
LTVVFIDKNNTRLLPKNTLKMKKSELWITGGRWLPVVACGRLWSSECCQWSPEECQWSFKVRQWSSQVVSAKALFFS